VARTPDGGLWPRHIPGGSSILPVVLEELILALLDGSGPDDLECWLAAPQGCA